MSQLSEDKSSVVTVTEGAAGISSEETVNVNSRENVNDEDVDDLLDSALNDFDKKFTISDDSKTKSPEMNLVASSSSTKSQSATSSPTSSKSGSESFVKIDEMIGPLIENDPLLKEQFEKLAESCSKAASAKTDEELEASLIDTLRTLSDKAQSVANEGGISDDELANIWSNMGLEANNGAMPDFMPLVTNMMQNLLSKELLYPALQDLSTKYPDWLEANKDKISAEDLKRYTKQLDLMNQVISEFDSEQESDTADEKKARFQRILTVMQSMQNCGSPPTELIGDAPDFGNLGEFPKFPDIPGMPDQSQCSLM